MVKILHMFDHKQITSELLRASWSFSKLLTKMIVAKGPKPYANNYGKEPEKAKMPSWLPVFVMNF